MSPVSLSPTVSFRRAEPKREDAIPRQQDTLRSDFDRLVEPHLHDLFRVAFDVLKSEDLGWDAVQETLLRIWVQGWLPAEPRAALIRLVAKSALHQRRCFQRRLYHETLAASTEEDCCDEDPLRSLNREERARAVREALKCLDADHRDLLIRFEFQGESYATIADHLGIPVGTVRSRLSRARSRLRLLLENRSVA